MEKINHMQLGKQGITDNFISTLKTYFKKNKNVKITVLKTARPEKTDTKKYSDQILERLGDKFTSKIIGHTIALKKWRKARKQSKSL